MGTCYRYMIVDDSDWGINERENIVRKIKDYGLDVEASIYGMIIVDGHKIWHEDFQAILRELKINWDALWYQEDITPWHFENSERIKIITEEDKIFEKEKEIAKKIREQFNKKH